MLGGLEDRYANVGPLEVRAIDCEKEELVIQLA